MGVKSTYKLSRQTAIELYAEMKSKAERRKFEGEATAMDDTELENILEVMKDKAHAGEGFRNYLIVNRYD